MKPALPPSYVNTPVAIAYADADDALIVTMTRLLGLCWSYDYERSPALTPEQLAELTGRPRSTLYRHLKQLREMGWIRVDQVGRRMVIRPLVARALQAEDLTVESREAATEPHADDVLTQVLAEIGVQNPKREQLARRDLDPGVGLVVERLGDQTVSAFFAHRRGKQRRRMGVKIRPEPIHPQTDQ